MKKIICIFVLFLSLGVVAQENASVVKDSVSEHNRWTIEGMLGVSDGNKPYGIGFNNGEKDNVFSQFKINSYHLGVRYMMTPKFGLRAAIALNHYSDNGGGSLPYKTTQRIFSLEGVVNGGRLLDFSASSRFGLLLHGGMFMANMTSNTKQQFNDELMVIDNPLYKKNERSGGFVAGITPQYRIASKMAVFVDFSMYFSYRQHMNWDGTPTTSSDLLGKATQLSFGLSYSLGKDAQHGDWKSLKSENQLKTEALQQELKTKIEEIEVMLQDTDRDGVVDYLDVEPNSIGGVAVDTKGRAIDINKNGIPDELEPRSKNRGAEGDNEKESAIAFDYLVQQNLINLFFDVNKENPNTASASNLYYIINFLKTYPDTKVRIKGYADTTGSEKQNKVLAQKRAENIANFIIKSGINANRIEMLGVGIDQKLDTTSKTGLQLARRVSFELIGK